MPYVLRTQRLAVIKSQDPLFKVLDDLSFKAKNIYNGALYIQRQIYFENKKVLTYSNLYTIYKDTYETDYKSLPSQTSQQILKQVATNFSSFIKASKTYNSHPEKFLGKPRIPKYLDKTKGRFYLVFTNQQAYYETKTKTIRFPEKVGLPPIGTHIDLTQIPSNLDGIPDTPLIQQVRIIPKLNHYVIELVYNKKIETPDTSNIHYIAGIDIGIDNFSTITVIGHNSSHEPARPLIINGKGLKSYNKNFNKKLANLKSIAKTSNNMNTTHRIQNLCSARDRFMLDQMHKASRITVNYLLQNQVKEVIIGNNKNWKQNSKLSKKTNQTFIQIPFATYIKLLTYKLKEVGIRVTLTEESYTSGTSFLDNEEPTEQYYNKSRRIHRGQFQTNTGYKINADINASYQIINKQYKNLNYNFMLENSLKVSTTPIKQNIA